MSNYGSCLSDRSASSAQSQKLKLVTYNMHGFSQGYSTVRDLISDIAPEVFFYTRTLVNTCQYAEVSVYVLLLS